MARSSRPRTAVLALTVGCLLALAGAVALPTGAAATGEVGTETYRPQFHFTPEQNWMNDPNGLVHYDGEYHLFFQHNPDGNTWGNMSWGHAVSPDLVHWTQLPLAIPHTSDELVFSGSVVVDTDGTTGFGTTSDPAMVAVYTSAYSSGRQAQSLAYSLDRGRTWTRYAGNPVLDIGSGAFRDPKVQWYAPTRSWLMTVSLADEHRVAFYSSPDLKSWTALSTFGPAGAVGGAWECPDLFPLPVQGTGETKWVLVVSVNPGGVAGGSATQYFTGTFDGTTFTRDGAAAGGPPAGTVLQDFEDGYGSWTATGDAFSSGPATGALPGQSVVSGQQGRALANSFTGQDGGTGTLTSPTFTLDQPYLDFLVGGGQHPHVDGTGDGSAPPGDLLSGFEGDTLDPGWTADGGLAGLVPRMEQLPGQQGARALDTFVLNGNGTEAGAPGDQPQGTVTGPDFTIDKHYVDLLVAGGDHPYGSDGETAVELVVDGQVVASATGDDSADLAWKAWDVSAYQGRTAHVVAVDHSSGGWGHVIADDVEQSDTAARPAGTSTSVDLLVDGAVVRSTTGSDSESLAWTSWDLRDLAGRQARIQLVDRSTQGWGHVLADDFVLAAAPAAAAPPDVAWLDHGKDFYAAVTWNDAPEGQRYMIGWMNDWQYANDIPTSPWRSAMSVPRVLSLAPVDGQLRLVSTPVPGLASLHQGAGVSTGPVTIDAGTPPADDIASGEALDITADFDARDASAFGLQVRVGEGQQTVVGYDAVGHRLYVDRTRSGDGGFSSDFPGVQYAPLALRDGRVHLRVLVDWSSVEVFGGQGEDVITDQVFPDPGSRGVRLFSTGGSARLLQATVTPMGSYR